jgi:TolB-like protein/TM2 domain-containing membrane protein YozV
MHKIFIVLSALLATSLYAGNDIENSIQSLCDSLTRHFPDSILNPRLAVLPFTDNTGKNQGQAVAELAVNALQKQGKFKIVDRMEFQKAIAEIELGNSDMIDSTAALKVGKIMAAPYLLTGTIGNLFGMCRINAKIIRTETTELMTAATIAVSPVALDGLTKELMNERNQVTPALFRSLVAPGWGQFYSNQPVRGGISLALCAAGVGGTVYFIWKKETDWRAYQDNPWKYSNKVSQDSANRKFKLDGTPYKQTLDELARKDTLLYKTYTQSFDRMVVAASATIGVWALNIIDAAIAGAQAKRKFRPYFSISEGQRYDAGVAIRF